MTFKILASLGGILFSGLLLATSSAFAEAPVVGRDAAAKYLKNNDAQESSLRGQGGPKMLSLHVGAFRDSVAYEWGAHGRRDEIGHATYGVTYRMYEYGSGMDLNLRIDFIEYEIGDKKAQKMSIIPLLLFPDVGANFPLYFGAGVGAGVYLKQLEGESNLSLDYQLVAGARFTNLFQGTGFFLEGGLKNHIHILSDGQFNGTYLAGGMVFTF